MSGLDTSLDYALELDRADPLAGLRQEFHFPDAPNGGAATYLCGNSLGLQPRQAVTEVARVLADWQRLAVLGHHGGGADWMTYHDALAPSLAALVGAEVPEVVAMNSLTINLHLLLATFYRPAGKRNLILCESGSFPSDRYALVSQLRWHGLDERDALVELAPRPGEHGLRSEDIRAAIEHAGNRLALVLLPGVQYLTGQVLHPEEWVGAAHAAGARVGLDLAHAVGNTPLALHDWGVDFAVWCSYKYLNGGPGATAGAFVHSRHHDAGLPRLAGWWGNDLASRFEFSPEFRPAAGAEGWQVSNGPVLGMAPLKAALAQFEAAGLTAVLDKSRRLTGYLEGLLAQQCGRQIEIVTPRDPADRGAQLSLRVRTGAGQGRALFERLLAAGVIGDWRSPDIIRLAPAPLYNSYADCWRAVQALQGA